MELKDAYDDADNSHSLIYSRPFVLYIPPVPMPHGA